MFTGALRAQTYAVDARLVLVPPYSVYLPDYAIPGSEQIKLNLLLRDLNEPAYQVRLHFVIEGAGIRIETNPAFTPPPIMLEGGIPSLLEAEDLAPYLESRNLLFAGISKQQYETQAALPEGFYRFSVRVVDYRRPDRQLSRESVSNVWLVLNDPPRLNTPLCGTTLPVKDPQAIFFQWLPMNTGSPNSVLSTEYEFTLVEIRPQGRNPNDAINTTSPVYQTVVQETSLLYGLTEPLLLPGQEYAFRIQARDVNGRDMFKNQGYSQVCTFKYGEVPIVEPPSDVNVYVETERRAKVTWYMTLEADNYKVEYRKKADSLTTGDATWFTKQTSDDNIVLTDLQPETDYEIRVSGLVKTVQGRPTAVKNFRTPAARVFACGQEAPVEIPADTKPLLTAMVGQLWKVGQFDMEVMEFRGGDGVFTGIGAVIVPYLGFRVYSTFNQIKVNDKREVIDGEVVSLSEGIEAFKDRVNQTPDDEDAADDNTTTGTAPSVPAAQVPYEGTIDSVYVDPTTGGIVIVDGDGSTTTVEQPVNEATGEKQPVAITDSAGNTYTVSPDGSVSAPASSAGSGANPAMTDQQFIDLLKKVIGEQLPEFSEEIDKKLDE